MVRCRWRGKSPGPASGCHEGRRYALHVDGVLQGSAKAPLSGDETASRFCMVRCRWRGTSPGPTSGATGDTVGGAVRLDAECAAGRGDATGARSGPPCQDVWYYHTHLAGRFLVRPSFTWCISLRLSALPTFPFTFLPISPTFLLVPFSNLIPPQRSPPTSRL